MSAELRTIYVECARDSPSYRRSVGASYLGIAEFQEAVGDVAEGLGQAVKAGIAFCCQLQAVCAKVERLQGLGHRHEHAERLQRDVTATAGVVAEFKERFRGLVETLHDSQRTFRAFQDGFRELDLRKKQFVKASDYADACCHKSACLLPRAKPNEIAEADKTLALAKKEFREASFGYLSKIERQEIEQQRLLAGIFTDIVRGTAEYCKKAGESLGRLETETTELETSRSRHDKIYKEKCEELERVRGQMTEVGTESADCGNSRAMEGYLFRSPRKSWLKWQRRWFQVDHSRLLSCKRTDDCLSVVEEDLRVCTARELSDASSDRRFCFELIGLDHSVVLQAEDEAGRRRWVDCFQRGISNHMGTLEHVPTAPTMRLSDGPRGTSDRRKSSVRKSVSVTAIRNDTVRRSPNENRKSGLLKQVLSISGNGVCCDCNDTKPRWASSSLGITLCTECSGSHRSLGVHVSKVRSLTLDNWEPEMLCVMFMLGNDIVNQIYESDRAALAHAASSANIVKPNSNTDANSRKLWAQAKWQKKQFVNHNGKELLANVERYIRENIASLSSSLQSNYLFTTPSDLIRYSLEAHCLPMTMLALALQANPNGEPNDDFYPLHVAAACDFWPGCEFLILNGARIDIVDKINQTALHKACQFENVLVVWLLLKRGARQNIRDTDDNDVLQIAMNTSNANTVTLLRLQMLNENTKEANLGSGGDETVNDVFLDFTSRAFDQIDEWFFSDSGRFHRSSSSKSSTSGVQL